MATINEISNQIRSAGMGLDQIPGGLADNKRPEDFDPAALEKGIKVEMEHTNDRTVAQEIAMDHLTEDPEYYDKLEVMEQQNGVNAVAFARFAARPVSLAERQATTIQTVIFDKEKFDAEKASKWLSDHDFKNPGVDETDESLRYRQREPGDFDEGSFRTIDLDTGIKAVIGHLKG